MIHQVVTRVSLETFKKQTANKKIVLLYPQSNYRNLFLSHFLSNAGNSLLYYRIPDGVNELPGFLAGMASEFDSLLGGFGDNLAEALQGDSINALGEALSNDLGTLKSKEIILYIDELDRIKLDDGFNRFIRAVLNNLPDGIQVVFSSRRLTDRPWYDLIAEDQATVLGTEHLKDEGMFTLETGGKPQLEVFAFGRGHGYVNGGEVGNWDGALPRQLFFYFVDNQLVTRDDIFDTFWPNLTVKEATNVFHVTKRKISERISVHIPNEENYELTIYASGFYMPSDKITRHYDVGDFQAAVEQANTTTNEEEEEALLRRAVDLYKAPFLETMQLDWVIERRQHLQRLYAQVLIGLGRINRARGDLEEALGFFMRALKEAPEREEVHRNVMQIYIDLNMPQDARKQYDIIASYLREHYNAAPSEETQALHRSI